MGKNGTDERTDGMTDRRTDEVRRAIPDKKITENFKWDWALMVSDFHETFRIC